MSDSFSDVSDAEVREQCLGFVEQLRSGKPASVIGMVMRSRGVSEALMARIHKAAGSSGGAAASSSSSSSSAADVSAAMKKTKSKEKEKSSSAAASSAGDDSGEKKKKKKKDKEKVKDESLFGESSDEELKPKPQLALPAPVAPAPAESQALVVADDHERKKKKKKERAEREAAAAAAASSPASAAAASSIPAVRATNLSSIDDLASSKKVKKPLKNSTVDSNKFAQQHLGAAPTPAATQPSAAHPRKPVEQKLRAYDDASVDQAERMYGGSEPTKEKGGCVIC